MNKRRPVIKLGVQAKSGLGLSTGTARGDSALPMTDHASENSVTWREGEKLYSLRIDAIAPRLQRPLVEKISYLHTLVLII